MRSEEKLQKDIDALEEARNRFITEIAKNIHLYNITPSAGRLYGTVFFAEEPMTLDEMSKAMGMSKTSMSTGIRSLLDANMVERVWERGIRKDLYKAEDDWYKSFSNVFINRWRNATELNLDAIKETKQLHLKLLKDTDSEDIRKKVTLDLEKLEEAEQYYYWLTNVISLFETGEIYDIVPKHKKSD
ncbi:GbsR/MarR family transcriptional regulator [Evansella cellulosilytica]|uniref:HTH-type transcriptional regulator n=1 Tax=Evansella cellulosilytica (strain ATCC 21833 / DSM 2522 / FERM P-1141 / JCM 9156 / N-4) TaxID=649639 RepID=E6TV28_EVAC2|nr:transcriptional regulator [Evansella cellulosilytica]ADU28611.1 transcriptional regulator protein-like protein [Evansella cellulosilytica DSM 2522]